MSSRTEVSLRERRHQYSDKLKFNLMEGAAIAANANLVFQQLTEEAPQMVRVELELGQLHEEASPGVLRNARAMDSYLYMMS